MEWLLSVYNVDLFVNILGYYQVQIKFLYNVGNFGTYRSFDHL